jgi:hypothetical protein
MLVKIQGDRNLIHCRKKCKLVQPWKLVWRVFRKLKLGLLYHTAILLWGIYPKELKSAYNKDIYTKGYTHNSQVMESASVLVNR